MSGKAGDMIHDTSKMIKSTKKPVKNCLATQHDNLKMLTEKHNDDKLVITFLIVEAGLIAYHVW